MIKRLICWFKGHQFKRHRANNWMSWWGSFIRCDRCDLSIRRQRWLKGKICVGDVVSYSLPERYIDGVHEYDDKKQCHECLSDAIKIFNGGYPGKDIIDRCARYLHENYHKNQAAMRETANLSAGS